MRGKKTFMASVQCLVGVLLLGLKPLSAETHSGQNLAGIDTIVVSSTAFASTQSIPMRYTCDGANLSPPLAWKGIPGATRSIALIVDDPDAPAGTWVHWVVYDLVPSTAGLPEGIGNSDTLAGGAKQGMNDFGRSGYGGPCPPGGTHRYFFKVYALDIPLSLPPGRTKQEIERAMRGHVIGYGELYGVYRRKR